MKIDATFLRSKVARRIFMLFIVSALLPVATLAFLSFSQVTTHLNEQNKRHLHQSSKAVGMAILERLLGLEAELQMVAFYVNTGSDAFAVKVGESFGERLQKRFTNISLVTDSDQPTPILGGLQKPPELTKAEYAYIASGKSVLSIEHRDAGAPRVFLTTALDSKNPGRGLVVGEVDSVYLWDISDTLTLTMEFCVLDSQFRVLFCSHPVPDIVTKAAKLEQSHSALHELPWRKDEDDYLVNFWSIFLKAAFLVPEWTVVVGESKSQALQALTTFKEIFPSVILMAILLVLLLSTSQIRRSLVPLESLRDGTHKIANREFDSRVDVKSGDEFEELADSFNTMAFRLGRQFTVLATMAEIDRLILSALDTKHIVKTILLRMGDIVVCDCVGVTLIDADSPRSGRTFFGIDADGELASHDAELSTEDIQVVLDNPGVFQIRNDQPIPKYLQPLAQKGAKSHVVLPIFLDDELSALITLGFVQHTELSGEDVTQARRLADRVTVALSNATWEEKLYHHAHYDPLTDLPNRTLLKDRLPQALVRAKRNDTQVAVLFLDLDRFKSINDSLGHAAGDLFLREITHRLTQCVRTVDTVARLGGDEFTIIVPDITADQDVTADITLIADKILSVIAQPFMLHGHEVSTTASIGIALCPQDADDYDELLKNADSAMYHAKSKGRGNYQFYSPDLNAAAIERLDMENSLRHALEQDQLELYYHPQVEISSGQIVGAEALLRWWHPKKGLIPPSEFIPLAEHTGLIVPIGEWVLKTACSQNKAWRDAGFAPIRVAINLAGRQFSDQDLVRNVERILRQTGLEPDGLELEITEGTVMEDTAMAIKILNDLKRMGLQVAIDDFGTGYSSLTYLKQFPIHTLKIDQSFVRDITTDRHDASIVATIIGLGHSLNLKVVAEGVETEEQLRMLRASRCDEFQGYRTSKPLPAREFEVLLAQATGTIMSSQRAS
jgi:diguanylate cyclase (GGDEF)-like protein